MHEQELEKIVDTLRAMEGRFKQPKGTAAPHLSSADRAAFKRLMLEAKPRESWTRRLASMILADAYVSRVVVSSSFAYGTNGTSPSWVA